MKEFAPFIPQSCQRFLVSNENLFTQLTNGGETLDGRRFAPFSHSVRLTRNYASKRHFPKGDLEILVSYETAVAFRDGGRTFCTPQGEFSRTTDKAIRNFAPGDCVRLNVSDFNSALSLALEGNG